jgi:hypothetical protein
VESEPRRRTRPSIIIGQLLASGYTAFFLTILIGEGISEGGHGLTWEGAGLIAVMLFGTASVLVAWVDPSLGSRLLLAAGIVLAAFVAVTAGSNRVAAVVLLSAPYLLSAFAIRYGLGRLARRDGPAADA